MGNICACLAPKSPVKKKRSNPAVKRLQNPPSTSSSAAASGRWSRIRSSRKDKLADDTALAAAILFGRQNGVGPPFDRSSSLRYPNSSAAAKKSSNPNALPRSSSSRARSLTDPLLQPHQLVNQVSLP